MPIRDILGDFCSVICFKYIIRGVEDVLGEDGAATVFLHAGMARGSDVAKEAGLSGSARAGEELVDTLQKVFGKEGTCLCHVESVAEEGDTITVTVQESICSCGEDGSRKIDCYYTLGALQGFLNEVKGKNLRGVQTAWVTAGGSADVFEFDPLG